MFISIEGRHATAGLAQGTNEMQVPTEIVFQNCEPSETLRAEVERQVARLEKFSGRITSCRVVIRAPETRHRHGDAYRIELRIALPAHQDVVVNRTHGDEEEDEHPLVAVSKAFAAAQRQIEDAMREMRGDIKEHVAPDHGRVARFVAGEDYGFIEASDGRELYFHRNAVLNNAFNSLAVGDEVRFVESEGEKGPQASSVRPIGKHHLT
ncbi:MAG: HPF/RaiA family ribosome-associated protein [Devosia sp.]|uniref:HPF/RaiA family ribosome-associated protein n=1 Tax=Devosia sp. TaxID=1871048 RepID=UPI001AD182BD|nr:HPF/RaiA family ribosome-associated protein [Devosia sp.]MBN9316752.1 HPF/RaiA family ribosome-associated protein [Devosia sp.]